MGKIRLFWEKFTIKNKIRVFTASVFVALFVALLLDVWIVKLFMIDFNAIMEDNSRGGEIVIAISKETEAFDDFIRGTEGVDLDSWEEAVNETKNAIDAVPLSYADLGENRFAQLQALRTSYEVYCSYRNQVVTDHLSEKIYVEKLYDVYRMHKGKEA